MRHSSLISWWWDNATALTAASITIWLRSWTVPSAIARGDPWGKAEINRMTVEKLIALQEGYVAAWRTALLLPWAHGSALPRLVRTGRAFSRPGAKKAKSNARRLSRLR